MVKVVPRLPKLPVRAALTVTGPAAPADTVATVDARPCVLEVLVVGLRVAAPAGETVQTTEAPEIPFKPLVSVTFATRVADWPGLRVWEPPLET